MATIDETGQTDDATVTVNTNSLTATLVVEKKVEWGIDSQYVNHPVFEITIGSQLQFWLGDGESQSFELEVGTYSISEQSEGWSTRVLIQGSGYDEEIEGSNVNLELTEDETVTVTFVNRPPDFVIPETPLGTIVILASMLIAYLLQQRKLKLSL